MPLAGRYRGVVASHDQVAFLLFLPDCTVSPQTWHRVSPEVENRVTIDALLFDA